MQIGKFPYFWKQRDDWKGSVDKFKQTLKVDRQSGKRSWWKVRVGSLDCSLIVHQSKGENENTRGERGPLKYRTNKANSLSYIHKLSQCKAKPRSPLIAYKLAITRLVWLNSVSQSDFMFMFGSCNGLMISQTHKPNSVALWKTTAKSLTYYSFCFYNVLCSRICLKLLYCLLPISNKRTDWVCCWYTKSKENKNEIQTIKCW